MGGREEVKANKYSHFFFRRLPKDVDRWEQRLSNFLTKLLNFLSSSFNFLCIAEIVDFLYLSVLELFTIHYSFSPYKSNFLRQEHLYNQYTFHLESLNADFCTLSKSNSLHFERLLCQTAADCSRLLLIKLSYIANKSIW